MDTNITRNRLVSHETYLQIKQDQKNIALSISEYRKQYRNIVTHRRQFFHSKGINVPQGANIHNYVNSDYPQPDWDTYKKENNLNLSYYGPGEYARELNILYGIIRGKSYKQIEQSVRENNYPSLSNLCALCKKYSINLDVLLTAAGEIKYGC